MSRNNRSLLTLVVTLLVALGVVAVPAAADPHAVTVTGRAVDFTQGWKFALVNTTGADAQQPTPGDPSWRDVQLPHDWSIGLDPVKGEAVLRWRGMRCPPRARLAASG